MHKLTAVEPAPISPQEIPAFVENVFAAFHNDVSEHEMARWKRVLEPERTLALRDRGRIVAGTGIFSRRLTVPGGEVPMAGVTLVGVKPTHRRRGLLTALMRRQLADVHEEGREAVAALWASEGAIYGRFGYGMATTTGNLDVDKRDARLRSRPKLAVELMTPPDALEAMRALHDTIRPTWPGMLDRDGPWWDDRIDDPEEEREGAWPLRAAVVPDAYALYSVKRSWADGRSTSEVIVREVVAVTPEAGAAIWGFLLGLDLTTRLLYWLAPADEPLQHMITEAYAVKMRIGDGLWVRLVDLPRALRERSYAEPFEVVLEVADDVCPWNAARWALRFDGTTATCGRTAVAADLELGVAELGAAHLGGTTLAVLARAGRVRELRDGALARASRAFRAERAPWCPEIF
jgi:predicted acetyltransferase